MFSRALGLGCGNSSGVDAPHHGSYTQVDPEMPMEIDEETKSHRSAPDLQYDAQHSMLQESQEPESSSGGEPPAGEELLALNQKLADELKEKELFDKAVVEKAFRDEWLMTQEKGGAAIKNDNDRVFTRCVYYKLIGMRYRKEVVQQVLYYGDNGTDTGVLRDTFNNGEKRKILEKELPLAEKCPERKDKYSKALHYCKLYKLRRDTLSETGGGFDIGELEDALNKAKEGPDKEEKSLGPPDVDYKKALAACKTSKLMKILFSVDKTPKVILNGVGKDETIPKDHLAKIAIVEKALRNSNGDLVKAFRLCLDEQTAQPPKIVENLKKKGHALNTVVEALVHNYKSRSLLEQWKQNSDYEENPEKEAEDACHAVALIHENGRSFSDNWKKANPPEYYWRLLSTPEILQQLEGQIEDTEPTSKKKRIASFVKIHNKFKKSTLSQIDNDEQVEETAIQMIQWGNLAGYMALSVEGITILILLMLRGDTEPALDSHDSSKSIPDEFANVINMLSKIQEVFTAVVLFEYFFYAVYPWIIYALDKMCRTQENPKEAKDWENGGQKNNAKDAKDRTNRRWLIPTILETLLFIVCGILFGWLCCGRNSLVCLDIKAVPIGILLAYQCRQCEEPLYQVFFSLFHLLVEQVQSGLDEYCKIISTWLIVAIVITWLIMTPWLKAQPTMTTSLIVAIMTTLLIITNCMKKANSPVQAIMTSWLIVAIMAIIGCLAPMAILAIMAIMACVSIGDVCLFFFAEEKKTKGEACFALGRAACFACGFDHYCKNFDNNPTKRDLNAIAHAMMFVVPSEKTWQEGEKAWQEGKVCLGLMEEEPSDPTVPDRLLKISDRLSHGNFKVLAPFRYCVRCIEDSAKNCFFDKPNEKFPSWSARIKPQKMMEVSEATGFAAWLCSLWQEGDSRTPPGFAAWLCSLWQEGDSGTPPADAQTDGSNEEGKEVVGEETDTPGSSILKITLSYSSIRFCLDALFSHWAINGIFSASIILALLMPIKGAWTQIQNEYKASCPCDSKYCSADCSSLFNFIMDTFEERHISLAEFIFPMPLTVVIMLMFALIAAETDHDMKLDSYYACLPASKAEVALVNFYDNTIRSFPRWDTIWSRTRKFFGGGQERLVAEALSDDVVSKEKNGTFNEIMGACMSSDARLRKGFFVQQGGTRTPPSQLQQEWNAVLAAMNISKEEPFHVTIDVVVPKNPALRRIDYNPEKDWELTMFQLFDDKWIRDNFIMKNDSLPSGFELSHIVACFDEVSDPVENQVKVEKADGLPGIGRKLDGMIPDITILRYEKKTDGGKCNKKSIWDDWLMKDNGEDKKENDDEKCEQEESPHFDIFDKIINERISCYLTVDVPDATARPGAMLLWTIGRKCTAFLLALLLAFAVPFCRIGTAELGWKIHAEFPQDHGATGDVLTFDVMCKEERNVRFTAEVIVPENSSHPFGLQLDNRTQLPWHTGPGSSWFWSSRSPKIQMAAGFHKVKLHEWEDGVKIRALKFEAEANETGCHWQQAAPVCDIDGPWSFKAMFPEPFSFSLRVLALVQFFVLWFFFHYFVDCTLTLDIMSQILSVMETKTSAPSTKKGRADTSFDMYIEDTKDYHPSKKNRWLYYQRQFQSKTKNIKNWHSTASYIRAYLSGSRLTSQVILVGAALILGTLLAGSIAQAVSGKGAFHVDAEKLMRHLKHVAHDVGDAATKKINHEKDEAVKSVKHLGEQAVHAAHHAAEKYSKDVASKAKEVALKALDNRRLLPALGSATLSLNRVLSPAMDALHGASFPVSRPRRLKKDDKDNKAAEKGMKQLTEAIKKMDLGKISRMQLLTIVTILCIGWFSIPLILQIATINAYFDRHENLLLDSMQKHKDTQKKREDEFRKIMNGVKDESSDEEPKSGDDHHEKTQAKLRKIVKSHKKLHQRAKTKPKMQEKESYEALLNMVIKSAQKNKQRYALTLFGFVISFGLLATWILLAGGPLLKQAKNIAPLVAYDSCLQIEERLAISTRGLQQVMDNVADAANNITEHAAENMKNAMDDATADLQQGVSTAASALEHKSKEATEFAKSNLAIPATQEHEGVKAKMRPRVRLGTTAEGKPTSETEKDFVVDKRHHEVYEHNRQLKDETSQVQKEVEKQLKKGEKVIQDHIKQTNKAGKETLDAATKNLHVDVPNITDLFHDYVCKPLKKYVQKNAEAALASVKQEAKDFEDAGKEVEEEEDEEEKRRRRRLQTLGDLSLSHEVLRWWQSEEGLSPEVKLSMVHARLYGIWEHARSLAISSADSGSGALDVFTDFPPMIDLGRYEL